MTDKLREAAQQAPMAYYALVIKADSGYESTTEGRCTADQYGAAMAALNGTAALAQQDAQAVPHGEAIVEEFSAWLNERRGMSVAWVFHDVVAKFRAMLNAAPTPPAQRVELTEEEISSAWRDATRETLHDSRNRFAQEVIEAYERKNGVKP